jgi:hypothetical protein
MIWIFGSSDDIFLFQTIRDLFLGSNIFLWSIDEMCSPHGMFLFHKKTRFVPRTQFLVHCVDKCFSRTQLIVPWVYEIFFPQKQHSCSLSKWNLFFLVPCVDEICSLDAILVPYSRRDLFLRHNILIPRVDDIWSSKKMFLVSTRFVPRTQYFWFLGRHIIVPEYKRFVPREQYFSLMSRWDVFPRRNVFVP